MLSPRARFGKEIRIQNWNLAGGDGTQRDFHRIRGIWRAAVELNGCGCHKEDECRGSGETGMRFWMWFLPSPLATRSRRGSEELAASELLALQCKLRPEVHVLLGTRLALCTGGRS